MSSPAPILALVGATGLVGGYLLPTFLSALKSNKLSSIRILTSSPDSPKLDHLAGVDGVEIVPIAYRDPASLATALRDVGILVSAMGTSTSKEGEYEANKATLLKAAADAGVKVYVPSEFGTDHNSPAAKALDSPMFRGKQAHHREAERLGIRVLSFYNALLIDISFSSWLGLDISAPNPTWMIPTPSYPVAFTSSRDLGPFVLSATLQAYNDVEIPSRLRIYSDSITLEKAADSWEEVTGGKIERKFVDEEGLKKKYEEIKPTLGTGQLGPAIPWMMSQGAFDYDKDNSNALLNRGEFAFVPTTLADFFKQLAAR